MSDCDIPTFSRVLFMTGRVELAEFALTSVVGLASYYS